MFPSICFGLVLFGAVRLCAQVEPDATGGSPDSDNEFQMSMPTQVSGRAYPMSLGGEQRSNYLSGGLTFTTAYDDNVTEGADMKPIGATSFSVFPSFEFRRTTPRNDTSLRYGAGFSFYHPTSNLNMANQDGSVDLQYRLSRHSSLSVQDSFYQNSNALSQPYTLSGTSVSGSTISQPGQVIVPYANQWGNSTRAEFSYQFSRDAMFGGAGTYSVFRYPDLNQVTGLYNSDSGGALGFYSRRLGREQYLGAIYQYSRTTTTPLDTTSHAHVISIFYSLAPSRRFSLSLTAGPQFYDTQEVGYPKSSSVGSLILAGIHWNGDRTSAAASYSQSVTTGQGLVGVYKSYGFNGSVNRQLTRTWSGNISGSYYNLAEALLVASSTTAGGHTAFGAVSVAHALGEHWAVEADYRRLHQTYPGVVAISNSTDDDRVGVAISYQFTRALGR